MRLHDVDFSRNWPNSVGLIRWKQPNGWPQPVALRQLGNNLNSAVSERETFCCTQPSRLNWVNVRAVLCIALTSIPGVRGAIVGGRTSPKAIGSRLHCAFADLVCCKGWLQVQNAVFNEGVFPLVEVHLELPVTATTHGDLVLPPLEVEFIEVILKDQRL